MDERAGYKRRNGWSTPRGGNQLGAWAVLLALATLYFGILAPNVSALWFALAPIKPDHISGHPNHNESPHC